MGDFQYLIDLYQNSALNNLWRAIFILALGWIISKLVTRLIAKFVTTYFSKHHTILMIRASFWILFSLFAISALNQLGFKLSVLLGAAGIVSVALGFASQTSASNLISGLFVLSEKSFEVGDVIEIGSTTGEVLSVDLLSVKLRTFDNLFVRIPNETIIKSEVKTLTKFPIRRFDLQVGIAYRCDIEHTRRVLLRLAEANPLCLTDPAPLIILKGFNNSSIDIQFSIWASKENFLALKNSIQEEVKLAFDHEGIEIPFPHTTFYTGVDCPPLPIRLITTDNTTNQDSQHEQADTIQKTL